MLCLFLLRNFPILFQAQPLFQSLIMVWSSFLVNGFPLIPCPLLYFPEQCLLQKALPDLL